MTVSGGRLASAKYQRAIAGLVMAQSSEWSLDLREHEFDETEALRRALWGTSCLVSLNGLVLKDNADVNINRSLQRDRWPAAPGFCPDGGRWLMPPSACRRAGCLACFAGRKEFEV